MPSLGQFDYAGGRGTNEQRLQRGTVQRRVPERTGRPTRHACPAASIGRNSRTRSKIFGPTWIATSDRFSTAQMWLARHLWRASGETVRPLSQLRLTASCSTATQRKNWDDPDSPLDLPLSANLISAAIVYDVLFDHLEQAQRALCREKIAASAEALAVAVDHGIWWEEDLVNNHNWVNFDARPRLPGARS
jgi:hypothetical protein